MASKTQSNEPETQLVEDEAPLELKDGLGTSLIPEQDVCVADKQEDQWSVGSLESQGQQARPRTRKAVSASLENLRKKRNRAGEAVKARISRIDQLLLEQCTDIVKLTASKDGLNMDMDNLKRFHNEISDLLMLNSDNEFPNEDHEYFDRICDNYLDCCADVKTKINDLTQERFEMLTQRSHKSSTKSSISKLSKVSSISSRQAAANAAGLKQRMTSLIRQQELKRKKEELQLLQRELERQGEQERLQGEINAVVAIHDTLVEDTKLSSNNYPSIPPPIHNHPSISPPIHDHPSIPPPIHDHPSIPPPIHDHPSIPPSNHDHPSTPTHTHNYQGISPPIHDHPSIPPPIHDYPSISPPNHDCPSISPPIHDYPSIPPPIHNHPSISPHIHNHPKYIPTYPRSPNTPPLGKNYSSTLLPYTPSTNLKQPTNQELLPVNPNTIQPSTSYQDPRIGQTSQVNTNENTNVGSVATQLDPKIPAFQPTSMSASQLTQPAPHSTNIMEQIQRDGVEIQRQQIELMKRMSLPAPKPPVFSGNIIEFPKWVSAFDALIEEEAVKPGHKLYYLGEYTSGSAQKMINGLLGLQTEDAYKRARKILQDRFGDPYKIYEAYHERLKSWPICSKGAELQELSDFLVSTQETMKTVKYLREFDTFSAIQELVARLPSHYSNKWSQSAKKVEAKNGEYTFNDLVEFVQEAAADATHPVFSHEALISKRREIQKDAKQDDKKFDKKRKYGSFSTYKHSEQSHGYGTVKKGQDVCPLCDKQHKLEVCDEFLKKKVKERTEFAKSKGLCFSCLQQGHMARQCKGDIKCRTCKKPHATVLHFESKPNPNAEKVKEADHVTHNCAKVSHVSENCQDIPTSSLIIPVWICHKDIPSKKVMKYAVLDDQSDSCFITDGVCKELGVNGPETVIELGTMHTVQDIKTQKISGLIISPEDESVDIPLPKSFSREQIPARRDQIPTADMARNWSHLRPIAKEIPAYREDLDIGLLIGNNCVQAIKPRDVIPGNPRDPYAVRTVLGWGMIGATNQSQKHHNTDISNCHRIQTRDIASQDSPELNFISRKPTKEVLNPNAVRRMFEQDFSERNGEGKSLSQEDRRFLEKTKGAIHITDDGHYEMPLPFREKNIGLPFNRSLAESRLGRLKTRFTKDAKYKKDYADFIDDMIKKEYQGESLNRHLLQGPDLTNTLTGVRVNEEHRDYLRFLWWTDGDISKDPEEYRMKVHLFGATSSPGCCNLALKATAEDNEEEFGSDAATFLRNEFYVDDGLKSTPSVQEATTLVKNSVEMCRKGGFRLHKFLSNERKVIESIDIENRATEVKKLDLDHDVLPIERVLGVECSIYDPLGFVAPVLLIGKRILQQLCKDNADWDDPIPEKLKAQWERWRADIHLLEQMKVPRCFKPDEFGNLKRVELHHFSDASTDGYGQCSYLRLTNEMGKIHCSLVMAKSRVTPLKQPGDGASRGLKAKPEVQSNRKYIPVSVEEMELAEQYIVKLVQKQAFSKELSSLKQEKEDQNHSRSERKKRVVSKSSTLLRLDPFIDENGLIRVGGRIRSASIDDKAKHPIVLPKKEYLSELVVRQLHEGVEHQGRGITMNELV
ncbi:RNA-directed DNA polymerase from transposon X-element, partial [Paramuricea clavata]